MRGALDSTYRNTDGSPHSLLKSVEYSSMHYQYMRASVVWIWFTADTQFKPWWVPFKVPDDETVQQLVDWLHRKYPAQCVLVVKRWTPTQCSKCKRNYTLACKQAGHEKEIVQ